MPMITKILTYCVTTFTYPNRKLGLSVLLIYSADCCQFLIWCGSQYVVELNYWGNMPLGKTCKNYALNSVSKQCTCCGLVLSKKGGGRPINAKASYGYAVGRSGGRPSGTKASDGYSVGHGGGRGRVKQVDFDEYTNLPSEWDLSEETLNLDEALLTACARRVCQQRTFDGKSLGVGVCYGCGHMLFTCVDNVHTYLIDKPSGWTEDDAPASAYLTFMYSERSSTKQSWYFCGNCKNTTIPQDQHVGDVMDDSDLKPVEDCDMNFPQEISALRTKFERGQVALCGLFSSTVRQAGMTQYSHVQGEVYSITKLDRHFYGLFGFMAIKDCDI